jgi:hypothetical protein
MKPPRPTENLLVEVSTALAAGRLVELLRGHGLTKRTIDELLSKESAVTLKSMLTQHLGPLAGGHDPDSRQESGSFPSGGGRVLAFRARESYRR